ncbi:MAG: hypothetical protein R3B96_22845 [Pirellulaceae bacterium]
MSRPTEDRTVLDQLNPYETPRANQMRVFPYTPSAPPAATLLTEKFLYREIRLQAPLKGVLTYNAFQLCDELRLDDTVICRVYPWVRLYDRLEASVPTDEGPIPLIVTLEFSRFARIKRFTVRVADQIVYQEAAARPSRRTRRSKEDQGKPST